MGTTVAALRGKLGSTDYFIVAMKAKELVEKAIIPSEVEGWSDMTLEEKEQRDINYTRVKNQIAPYLATDKDRFFGAIILTVKNFDPKNFEPIADIATRGLPRLYQTQTQSMGFLTFSGGEILLPLDGQHRLKAIQFALDGKDEKGVKIPGMSPSSALANEDVTVILVPHDRKKSRKIFTKVNRYAKPTTTGQNLVTDDDDYIAVSSRDIANNKNIIGADLVKYTSNTLTDKDGYFTTLATIAACNDAILTANFPGPIDHTHLPDAETASAFSEKIHEVWEHLTENIEEFSLMLADKSEAGDEKRREMRQDYLLGKPVPQGCLFRAFAKLTASNDFTLKEASDKLNKFDWRKNAKIWDRLLISGSKILTKNAKVATGIIHYMAGGKLDEEQKQDLLANYRKLFPQEEQKNIKLPPLV